MSHQIIWTRTLDDWQYDQNIWQGEAGVLHWPLLSHRALKVNTPNWQPQLVLLTSQKALAFAREQQRIRELLERGIPVACFARKTFEAVRAAGYQAVLLEAQGGESFAKKLSACYPPSRAWYLASRQPAVAIDQILSRDSWQVNRIELYETIPDSRPPSAGVSAALGQAGTVICFASPSAVHAFALCSQQYPEWDRSQLRVVAIGETTAQACQQYFSHWSLSPKADLGVLWATAKKLAVEP